MSDRDADILKEARERFEYHDSVDNENREAARSDTEFVWVKGKQWPDHIRTERDAEQRPWLEINQLPQFISQVVNDQRMGRPGIRISPASGEASEKVAEILQGMIRHIEYDSNAEAAYDSAFAHAVTGGRGYWRVVSEYEYGKSFDQCLKVKRIPDPQSVRLDPDYQDPDGGDAAWAFVTETLQKDEFRRRWPDADAVSFDYASEHDLALWYDGADKVVIADYYRKVQTKRTLVVMSDGAVGWKDELPKELPPGIEIVREREAEDARVEWYKIAGGEQVLERYEWPGKYIPVVMCVGDEIMVDGKRIFQGLIRRARDPQAMYNFWVPICINTPIPTPDGWTTMGAIKAGDRVFDECGKVVDVVGTSPVHINRLCYRVEFDDGSHIIADAEHPWMVEERGKRKLKTFDWTRKKLSTAELRPGKHFIYATQPIELPEADLPIDPYLLGHWLGDGNSAEPVITPGDEDIEELRAILLARGHDVGRIRRFGDDHGSFTVHGVRAAFRELHLLGNKHIPAIYLRASVEQRYELLRGLMDSDGSIGRSTFQCSFTTVRPALAEGLSELLKSLGIKSATLERAARIARFAGQRDSVTQDHYQLSFTVPREPMLFRLTRKIAVQARKKHFHDRRTKRHAIRAVVPVASVPVKCIAVDSPSHLFLAGRSMIPTHNCQATELIALAPRAPYVAAHGQIEGFENNWQAANRKNISVLEYNPITAAGTVLGAPQRTQFAGVPVGIVEQANQCKADLRATIGIYDPSLGQRSNETSGRAIIAREKQGDTATFHFVDNLTRAIALTGRILVDVAPHYYDTERIVGVIDEEDNRSMVAINKRVPAPYDLAKIIVENDLSAGRFAVTVEAGPNYATKRQEAADSMLQFIQAYPPAAQVAGDLMAKAMDWPGSEQIANRLKLLLPPQIQQAEAEGQQQPIPPEVQAQMAQMSEQMQQAQAMLQQLQQENQQLKSGSAEKMQIAQMQTAQKEAEAADEIASKERIAQLNANVELAIAGLKEQTAETIGLGAAGGPPGAPRLADTIAQLAQSLAQMSALQHAPRHSQLILDAAGNPVGAVSTPIAAEAPESGPDGGLGPPRLADTLTQLARTLAQSAALGAAPRRSRLILDDEGNPVGGVSDSTLQ